MITSVLRNIFTTNLSVKRNERVLVFTDRPGPDELLEDNTNTAGLRTRLSCIAFLAAEIGKTAAREVICVESESVGAHGAEPPPQLWGKAYGDKTVAALRKARLFSKLVAKKISDQELRKAEDIIRKHRNDAVDAVIALSYFSTSHTRFRDMLTRLCGARYASMPLFDMDMLEGPMDVDWNALAVRTKRIARTMAGAETIEISTPNGTSLSFSVKGRKTGIDTGLLNTPGAFGNLPAGEVYIAPLEGTANGQLVLEWSPVRELRSPVTLIIRNGLVEEVLGKEEFALQLEKKIAERFENRNIAEFGIGTNNRAKRPDNILESEKILGTVH
ncbi:MAG TPA: hypothetical protein VEP69_06635, partial [Thermodesulfovibrionales bacterium]|nr:hypothetical protein [Thermodesulfovibrionales bacterium]